MWHLRVNQVTKRNSNLNKPFEAGHTHGTFVQNHYAGEKGTHWDKKNKENYHFKRMLMWSLCLSCSTASLAQPLQQEGFVPHE